MMVQPKPQILDGIERAVEALELDLRGCVILTEAATGIYAVTPVIAALAGARVYALARDSKYGSAHQAQQAVMALAGPLGIAKAIRIVRALDASIIEAVDIFTNSGHLRPLGQKTLQYAKASAIVATMYEAWELRPSDIDLSYCRERGITVVSTNEAHPQLNIFSYLPTAVENYANQFGVDFSGHRLVVLSDNAMGPALASHFGRREDVLACRLVQSEIADSISDLEGDVLIVATTPPAAGGHVTPVDGGNWQIVVQLYGDIERHSPGSATWLPLRPPRPGHMGVSLVYAPPEAVIRLQAGGLKAAASARLSQDEGFYELVTAG